MRQAENCRAIAAGDGIDLVVRAMCKHPKKESVQRSGCIALRNMSTHRTIELRQIILDNGGEEAICSARANHKVRGHQTHIRDTTHT